MDQNDRYLTVSSFLSNSFVVAGAIENKKRSLKSWGEINSIVTREKLKGRKADLVAKPVMDDFLKPE